MTNDTDNGLNGGFKPYTVSEAGMDREGIEVFSGQVIAGYKEKNLVSPFAVYEKILGDLTRNPKFEFAPLSEIRHKSRKVKIALRHDIDGDIHTSLKIAEYLASKSIPGAFFILHTSGYYGYIKEGIFIRNTGMEHYIRALAATGNEFGLHTDPLSLYCHFGIDGSAAVVREIDWLRHLGMNISGSVAHNSAVVFGAENFEIFTGRAFRKRTFLAFKDTRIPLQTLDEKDLGLTFEGNFPKLRFAFSYNRLNRYIGKLKNASVRDMDWHKDYFLKNPIFKFGYEVNAWLLQNDGWVLASRKHGIKWPLDTQSLIDHLVKLPNGYRVVLSVHPEYVAG